VVVGVQEPGGAAAALDVAFGAAVQRGLGVTAVHAWTPDVPADHEGVCGPSRAAEERASRLLDRVLAPWRARYPDVPVVELLARADAADALISESEGAALLVVGRRAHGLARAAMAGSVSRSIAQRARCPVVVVPTAKPYSAKAVRDRHAEPGRNSTPRVGPAGTDTTRGRRSPWA
jgi:nucleotide-binding universal stress UspA family protein